MDAASPKIHKPFPIPVQMIGPGSQPEDDTLDYIRMPRGMDTWQPPRLPEPEQLMQHHSALNLLQRVLEALDGQLADGGNRRVNMAGLSEADRALVHQVLGEGEVSALQVQPAGELRVQEAVFAGLWRVVGGDRDDLEIGEVPQLLRSLATPVDPLALPASSGPRPPGVLNAPAVLSELAEQLRSWRPGEAAQVINLSLLPLSPEDLSWLGELLGRGATTILSRGYGNCRVSATALPRVWQVVYYNSQDQVILSLLEVCDMPDVVRASREDIADSRERLAEALAWLERPA